MEQYSWNQLSENKIVKTLDYSAFRTGSGIPQAMMCQSVERNGNFYGYFTINCYRGDAFDTAPN